MVCLTYLGVDCCGGFTESCSIFSFAPGKWDSLLCGGQFCYSGTSSIEV
jgi:hypothetical protein